MTDENQNDYSFLAEEQGKGEAPTQDASAGARVDAQILDGGSVFSPETPLTDNPQASLQADAFAKEPSFGSGAGSARTSLPEEKISFGEAVCSTGSAKSGGENVFAGETSPSGFSAREASPAGKPDGENIPAPALPFPAPPAARYVDAAPRRKKGSGKGGRFLRRTASLAAAALLFGIVAAGAFIGFNELYYHLNPSARPSQNAAANGMGDNAGPLQPLISHTAVASGTSVATADVSSIVDTVMPSLVSISCTFRNTTSFFGYLYEGTTEGSGSGIIVGKNDAELLIATNNHVVDDAVTTVVTFLDGSQIDATVRGTEEAADLAIVSVPLADIPQETLAALTIADLGNSDEVKVGQMVIAIGNSLGYGQTTTVGYLSAKEREVTVTDSSTGKSVNYIALQVDAAINPGNSGGALLDTNGRVIGINSAKLSSTNVEGIGYAIPINDAIEILRELMNREILTEEERGYLGVYLSEQEITAEIARLYGFPRGVFISDVVEGGAAARAGILSGDIITAVGGSPVTARTQLQEKVNSYRAGTEIEVTLARLENGEYIERNVTVVLGSKADFD